MNFEKNYKKYLRRAFLIVISFILMFGIVLPYLISSDKDELVWLGIALAVLSIYLFFENFIKLLLMFLKNDEQDEKN